MTILLPNELYSKIFIHLNLSDFKNISLISDQFYHLIHSIELKNEIESQDLNRVNYNLARIKCKSFNNVFKFKNIISLNLSSGRINDEDLIQLSNLTQLEELNLSSCEKITAKGLSSIKDLINLISLDISFSVFKDGTNLSKLIHLKYLNVSNTKTNDDTMNEIKKLTYLKYLKLSDCISISNDGVKDLKELIYLKYLDLRGCRKINNIGLKYIGELTGLRNLNLTFCNKISNIGLKYIEELTKLENLNLASCTKINNGLKYLRKFNSLISLDLTQCNCVNHDLVHLRSLTKLKSLNLVECKNITDDGIKHISELNNLRSLNLSRCQNITDNDLKIIALKLNNLESINISSCGKITRKGLIYLQMNNSIKNVTSSLDRSLYYNF